MKIRPSSFRFGQSSALATLMLVLGFHSASAQNAAAGLSPEIAPLAAKYQSDLNALGEARNKVVAPARQSYLTALVAAEQKASKDNKPDEAKAVADEKTLVTAGRALAPAAAPLLPRALSMPRANLQREMERAEREYTVHAQQAAAEYLRGLSFHEAKARTAGQAELLKQIEAEKLKLTGQNPAGTGPPHGAARNIVLNGDFMQKKEDGSAESWQTVVPPRGAVTTEQGVTFLRMVSVDKKEIFYVEEVERPAGAKELAVAVRLRCRDMKGQGVGGVTITQRDGNDKVVAFDRPCALTGSSAAWKPLSGLVKLHSETKRLNIGCRIVDGLATVDFADVRVEPR